LGIPTAFASYQYTFDPAISSTGFFIIENFLDTKRGLTRQRLDIFLAIIKFLCQVIFIGKIWATRIFLDSFCAILLVREVTPMIGDIENPMPPVAFYDSFLMNVLTVRKMIVQSLAAIFVS
jgi:hypothetical protein